MHYIIDINVKNDFEKTLNHQKLRLTNVDTSLRRSGLVLLRSHNIEF